jgi:hypothetical protein
MQDTSWNEANESYSDLDADIFSTSINLSHIDKPGQVRGARNKRQRKAEKTPSYNFPKNQNSSKHSKKLRDDSHLSGDIKGKSGDMLIGNTGFSENFEDESICAIHHKLLDMICQEAHCESPICSSCILFGEHKNHQYIEKDKFFKQVETKRKGLLRVSSEIESAEIKLNKTNQMDEIFEKIRERRKKVEKELEFNCSKAIRQIENRKVELEKTTKVFFENLEEKIHEYLKQTLECIDLNQDWKRQCNELLRHLTEDCEEIENCFEFLKKMENLELATNGKLILDAISQVESMISAKIEESLRAFDFRIKNFDENFIQVIKNEVSFKNDLYTRMQEMLVMNKSTNFGIPGQTDFYQNNFEAPGITNEPNMGDPEYRVSDLMSDNFNPEGSNLMMGLNNQDSGFMHSQEPFEDPAMNQNQNNSQFMKSNANVYRNYVSNQNNTFPKRHVDFSGNGNPNVNTSGFGAKPQYPNMHQSQYKQRMMNKTRSTKQLLRSKNQSSNHAQNDMSKDH